MDEFHGLADGLLSEMRLGKLAEPYEDTLVHGLLGLKVRLEDADAANHRPVTIAGHQNQILGGILVAELVGELDIRGEDLVIGLGLDEHCVLDDCAHVANSSAPGMSSHGVPNSRLKTVWSETDRLAVPAVAAIRARVVAAVRE